MVNMHTISSAAATPRCTQGGCRFCNYAGVINQKLNGISTVSILGVHLFFAVLVLLLGEGDWHTSERDVERVMICFGFYNTILFVTLFWSLVDNRKPEPLQAATVVNLVSIVFDIIVACKLANWTLLFIILNIVFRPVTTLLLLRRSYQRKRQLATALLQAGNGEHTSVVSLGDAIRNLLYQTADQQQQESSGSDQQQQQQQTDGKSTVPKLSVFTTIQSTNRDNPNCQQAFQRV